MDLGGGLFGDEGAGQNPDAADPNYKFVPVPYQTLLAPNIVGQGQKSGVALEGAFRRAGRDVYFLHLKITNNSAENLSNFLLKVNNNIFGVQAEEPIPSSFFVAMGGSVEVKVRCSIMKANVGAQMPQGMFVVQAGIKCSLDLFYFSFPVLFQTLLAEQDPNAINKHEV